MKGGAPRHTPLNIGIGYLTLLTLTPERLQKLKVRIAKEVLKAEPTAEKRKAFILRWAQDKGV